MIRGYAIPGLGMAAAELPDLPGLVRLENPEVGSGATLPPSPYELEDIARLHAEHIARSVSSDDPLWIIGMSMGGMIAAILASEFRHRLPRHTQFLFLVTSANTTDLPAIPPERLAAWQVAKPGLVASFAEVMTPFFAPGFHAARPEVTEAYFRYRAMGGNQQSPRAFMRQVAAIGRYDGARYIKRIDPASAQFVTGADDLVLGPAHGERIQQLIPTARHVVIPGLGHMINLERPEFFAPWER